VTLRALAATAVAALFASGACAQSCVAQLAGGGERLESSRYQLVYRAQPEKIPLSEHFAVELAICARDNAPPPESVRVDAQMPAHRHGMNYKANVMAQGAGRYRADGLLFHMPGRWEFVFEVRAGGSTDRLTHSVVVE